MITWGDAARRTFSVDVDDSALGAALVQRPLRSHAQGVAQLRLACAELPKYLSDGASFDATTQKHV